MERINLKEIAKKCFLSDEESGFQFESFSKTMQSLIFKSMKEACKKALELAAENANLLVDGNTNFPEITRRYIVDEGNHYSETEIDIDKQSILNVIDLINNGYEY